MIYYTGHAKGRMLLRGITEGMVRIALRRPDEVGIGYEGRNLVFKKFGGGGVIKVVFVKKKSLTVIISVIWETVKKN